MKFHTASQNNTGQSVHAAMHDNIERQVVINRGAQLRPWYPSARLLDAKSRESEELFVQRFGFDASMSVRRSLISLKWRHDLTARSIRRLKTLGFLRVGEGNVSLHVSRIELWAACLLTTAVFGIGFAILSLLIVHPPHEAAAAASVVILVALHAAYAAAAYAIHIQPNILVSRLLQRSNR